MRSKLASAAEERRASSCTLAKTVAALSTGAKTALLWLRDSSLPPAWQLEVRVLWETPANRLWPLSWVACRMARKRRGRSVWLITKYY